MAARPPATPLGHLSYRSPDRSAADPSIDRSPRRAQSSRLHVENQFSSLLILHSSSAGRRRVRHVAATDDDDDDKRNSERKNLTSVSGSLFGRMQPNAATAELINDGPTCKSLWVQFEFGRRTNRRTKSHFLARKYAIRTAHCATKCSSLAGRPASARFIGGIM